DADGARVGASERRPALGRAPPGRRRARTLAPGGGDPRRGGDVSGARVLAVDDEPQILRALELKLRSAGYVPETAATAQEALTKAALRPPDAIILDVLLPDGHGAEVARELRTWTSVPILIVSAVGDEAEKIAALDAG